MSTTKTAKRLLLPLLLLFLFLNLIAAFHAYKFTHFAESTIAKTRDSQKLSFAAKIKTLLSGIDNPRPENKCFPQQAYETITLQSNKTISCWSIKCPDSKGTVILCHGYSGEKSSMLDKSDEFLKMGYNTLLIDFMGSGASEGNQTTVGFKEAEEVKTCFDYLSLKGEKHIYLFGTSMGAVAILKAIHDYDLKPDAILIECPFGSLYQTTCARFRTLGVPAFPMADLLVFWGGIENGFWAMGHKPTEYAKAVHCPTLLLYGEQDEKVNRSEIDEIYSNLKGRKQLITFPFAGHENYLAKYREQWIRDIQTFLRELKPAAALSTPCKRKTLDSSTFGLKKAFSLSV
jgi:alpha-beta hydrolase superfamily lysophospholipase